VQQVIGAAAEDLLEMELVPALLRFEPLDQLLLRLRLLQQQEQRRWLRRLRLLD
jgi:hypothetical protein